MAPTTVPSSPVPSGDETCDIAFDEGFALSEGAEVALEDYARAVFAAAGVIALRAPETESKVVGVRVRGPAIPLSPAGRRDLQDFALSLRAAGGGSGLGWS